MDQTTIKDTDLQFLEDCSDSQLRSLINWIIYDPEDGKKRLREALSKTPAFESRFKYNTKSLVPAIIDEILGFGANVVITKNSYHEILEKVCDKFGVNYHPLIDTERLEIELLKKLWDLELSKLTYKDINQISLETVRKYNKYTDGVLRGASFRVVIPCVLHIAFFRIVTNNNSYFNDKF